MAENNVKLEFKPAIPGRKSKEVLSINPNERVIDEQKGIELKLWHDIKNAHLNESILTGYLESIEPAPDGSAYCYTDFEGQSILIPIDEMGFKLEDEDKMSRKKIVEDKSKLANSMLGAEIDYIIKGFDEKSKTVVASRKKAMAEKAKRFYDTVDGNEYVHVYEGRKLEARIIAVSEYRVRAELYGVETSIDTKNLSRVWMTDVRGEYQVGDRLLVVVDKVEYPQLEPGVNCNKNGEYRWDEFYEDIKITCHSNLIEGQEARVKLDYESIRPQGKYTATVTDVHQNQYYLRINKGRYGVNAISHNVACDTLPIKGDKVAFSCTQKNDNKLNIEGIITRVING